MKKIRIQIDQLGPIVDQEIALSQVMLFTGDSNLGKSYVNFLCYYLFSLSTSDRLNSFLSNKFIGIDNEAKEMSVSIKTSDLRLWMEEDVKRFFTSFLAYPNVACNVHFYFDEAPEVLDIHIKEIESPDDNDTYISALLKISDSLTYHPRLSKVYKRDDIIRWVKYVMLEQLTGEFIVRSSLMPPGRASLLSGSFTGQMGSSRMGMYELFLRDNDRINFMASSRMATNDDMQFFLSRIKKLIGGEIVVGRDGIEFKLDNGQSLPLYAAASSIKELSPILLWIQGTSTMSYEHICIEEPEAHCHPMMQYQLADLLVSCVNRGVVMQITTHSDYFLTRINELIKLKQLRDTDEQRYNDYCTAYQHTRDLVLDKDIVGAYYFHYSLDKKRVEITRQDLSEGIPFDSFSKIVDKEIAFDNFIEGENADLQGSDDGL